MHRAVQESGKPWGRQPQPILGGEVPTIAPSPFSHRSSGQIFPCNGGWGGPTTLTSKFGVEGGPHCSVFSYDPGSVAAATSPLGLRKMGAAAGTPSTPRLGTPPRMVCHWLSVAVNVPHNAQCCHFFSPECIYLFHTSTETHTQCWHISVSTQQPASSVSSCLKSKFRNRS